MNLSEKLRKGDKIGTDYTHGAVGRGAKPPALAGDLPFSRCFFNVLPLSRLWSWYSRARSSRARAVAATGQGTQTEVSNELAKQVKTATMRRNSYFKEHSTV